MEEKLISIINFYIDNIDEDIVILTDYEHFKLLDNKQKGLDLELNLNTYKGYPIILRNDMPINIEFVIMLKKDYIRNERRYK